MKPRRLVSATTLSMTCSRGTVKTPSPPGSFAADLPTRWGGELLSSDPHLVQERERFQAAVEVVLELRLEHTLDRVHQRDVELQPPVGFEVAGGHQAQHLDHGEGDQVQRRESAPVAQEAARLGAERRR